MLDPDPHVKGRHRILIRIKMKRRELWRLKVNQAGSPSSHEGSPWRRGGSVGKRWISITLMRIRLLIKMKAGSGKNISYQNDGISFIIHKVGQKE
jgi:hypothetical protein